MKKWTVAAILVLQGIGAAVWIKERTEPKEEIYLIERGRPGTGDREIFMEVWDGEQYFPVKLQIKERAYSQEELELAFDEGKKWLDGVWLGNNSSSSEVSKNLYLPTEIKDLGLNIEWVPESFRWIRSDGTITEEALSNAPLDTKITAVIRYGSEERSYEYDITIVEEEGGEKGIESVLQAALDDIQDRENTAENVRLPAEADGRSLLWYETEDKLWLRIFVLGNTLISVIYLWVREEKKRRQKMREEGLERDYPDIVYRMILLIGSGMTVRSAWSKTVEAYEERKKQGNIRWGYEEMLLSMREMNYGISERQAYENFGRRCGIQSYIRFASLLIQQVERGAKGMNRLMSQEVAESEIMRRENARKAAETAGAQLLFPMMLLMVTVFAVLLIPAFLSMNI